MHVGGTCSRLVHLDLGPVPWQDRAGYVLATVTVHLFSGWNAQLSCIRRVTGPREARLLAPQLISALACGSLGTGSTLPPAAGVWSWLLSEPRPYV